MYRSVGGYHFMYADTFLDLEEFNEMFDLTQYQKVRRKYHAEGNYRNVIKTLHLKWGAFDSQRTSYYLFI